MKHPVKTTLSHTLTLFAAMSLLTSAYADDPVTAPKLSGGWVASIGTFYMLMSADNQDYVAGVEKTSINGTLIQTLNAITNDSGYDFGFEASLGYIFKNTSNGLEASYRGLNTGNSDSTTGNLTINDLPIGIAIISSAENDLDYNYDDADLLFTQYLNLGHHMQMRLGAGVAYLNLKQVKHTTYSGQVSPDGVTYAPATISQKNTSHYTGWGPRLGADARYALNKNFGLLAGVSTAFFLGSLDLKTTFSAQTSKGNQTLPSQTDNGDNEDVFNVSANVAIDYLYTLNNDSRTTIGIELGYRADFYDDGVGEIAENVSSNPSGTVLNEYITNFYDVTLSGPYLDIKAAF